jgi:hypothetical protein
MRLAEIRWPLAIAAAVALAVVTGTGAPGVAAPAWSLIAIAACLALGTWPAAGAWAAVLAAAGAGSFASAALLGPGFPLAHDLPLHVWTLESFARAVLAGDLDPRWHASIGLGTPLGVFYPPLPFWWGVPFYALDLPPADLAKGVLLSLHAAAAASMAAAVLHAGRGRHAAIASAAAYALAPYLLFDLHGRGALGEATALVFLPWLLAGLDRALRGERCVAALAAGGVGLVHAHALTLLLVAGAAPVAATVAIAVERGSRAALARRFARVAAVTAVGLAMGGHWLVPAFAESDRVALATVAAGAPGARYADFAPPAGALFERRAVDHFAGSLPRSLRATGSSEMPYYAGAGLLVAALAGAIGGWRVPGDRFAAALVAVSLALSVDPLASAWGRVEALARLQFPWRHLLLATPAAAWLAGGAIARFGALGGSLALFALALDALPYLGVPVVVGVAEEIVFDASAPAPRAAVYAPLRWGASPLRCEKLLLPPRDRRLSVWRSRPAYPEYMTSELLLAYWVAADDGDPDARKRAGVACEADVQGVRWLGAAPLASRHDGGALPLARVEDRGDRQVWHFDEPVQGSLRLLQAHFPGFAARDDRGRAIPLAACSGWICLDAREPTRAVELALGTTSARRGGIAASALAAAVLIALAAAERRGP